MDSSDLPTPGYWDLTDVDLPFMKLCYERYENNGEEI